MTTIEVDVPPLAADAGSAAETMALRLTRSNSPIAVSFATEAGHFQARRPADHRLRAGLDRPGA